MASNYVISLENMLQKCIALLNYSFYMLIALAVNYLGCVNHHCSVILFKFYRDGLMRGVIKCVQLKFHGYFCSTDRMLHKSQNEVASQLFLLHSYHQSKIYGCQDRSELHYMLISFVLSCVTMLLLDKSEHGSV